MKTKEEFRFSSEEVLDRYFPKGHKQRGNALLLFACSKLEAKQQTLKEVLKIIDKWRKKELSRNYDTKVNRLKTQISKELGRRMACKNCTCDKCRDYYNQYCPFCEHHIKYHKNGVCNQPTCKCQMTPLIRWKKKEELGEGK